MPFPDNSGNGIFRLVAYLWLMSIRRILLFVTCTLLSGTGISQTLSGRLTDGQSGQPIVTGEVEVRALQGEDFFLVTPTDSAGFYSFQDLKPGYYEMDVSSLGYTTQLLKQVLISAGKDAEAHFTLFPAINPLPDVLICASQPGSRPIQPLSEIPLSREQTQRFPATFFDPARLAQAYPGVANADDQANGLVIRGNNPASVAWRVEGVEVVNPNHLNNAGTLGDLSTTASGGVLMFSAQMMDNSSLLTGTLPAGYGNAMGGIMDIHLRNGNSREREFTVQAGLIGIDLAAEGPFTKKKKASYLANYRYSTVGLLGQMGISFGGETINFQDYSLKLNFPGNRGDEWSVFMLLGKSENRFSPPTDSSDIKTFKDLFQINFESGSSMLGIGYFSPIFKRSWAKINVVGSSQGNEREAEAESFWSWSIKNDTRLGVNLMVSNYLTPTLRFIWGTNGQYQDFDFWYTSTTGVEESRYSNTYIVQPWASFEWTSPDGTANARLGYHAMLVDAPNSNYALEPRIYFSKKLGPRHSINASYSLQSQAINPGTTNSSWLNETVNLPRGHHAALRHNWTFGEQWIFRTEFFYQYLSQLPAASEPGNAYSSVNISEFIPGQFVAINQGGKAENKGIELSLERYMADGWFMLSSLTLLDSRYKNGDSQWYDSRWDIGHIFNTTAGKEWIQSKTAIKTKAFGFNARFTWRGAYLEQAINQEASATLQETIYFTEEGFTIRRPDFFRIDARVYWRKSIGDKRNTTFAMDFQNLTLRENIAYQYYDPLTEQVETKYQLGLIPNLSWKLEF